MNTPRFAALVLSILLLFSLSSCTHPAEEPPAQEKLSLWLVTESTHRYGMNVQTEHIIKEFEREHENVTINMEILPIDTMERAVRLEELRIAMRANQGPDLFLLPTGQEVSVGDELMQSTIHTVTPLFRSAEKAMYDGLFADLSALYQADPSLNTDALNAAVMDAGTIGDARYILPLRYDFSTYILSPAALAELGLSMELFLGSYSELMAAAIALGDAQFAYGIQREPAYTDFLSPFDFKKGMVNLTEAALSDYLSQSQQVEALCGNKALHTAANAGVENYFAADLFFTQAGYAVASGSLTTALENYALAKVLGEEIVILPQRTYDGYTQAAITYWGAVGVSCAYPDLAYDFLRRFLTEEAQWELYTDEARSRVSSTTLFKQLGWPVRSEGAFHPLYERLRQRIGANSLYTYSFRSRKFRYPEYRLSAEEVPLLSASIDRAYFPLIMDRSDALDHYAEMLSASINHPSGSADVHEIVQQALSGISNYIS